MVLYPLILVTYSSDSSAKWSEWFEQKFAYISRNNKELDFEEFKKALHIKEVKLEHIIQ